MISSGTEQIHDINEICSAISHHMKGGNPYALFHFSHPQVSRMNPPCLLISDLKWCRNKVSLWWYF